MNVSEYDEEPEVTYRKVKPSRRFRVVRNIFIGFMFLVILLGGAGVYAYRHLEGNIGKAQVDNIIGKDRPKKVATAALNVLVMGSDTRKGKGNNDVGGNTPGLSDTTILLHLSADRKSAYGISIPRDAMVQRPTCKTKSGGMDPGGLTQFNAAFAIGGAACTIKTVESITNVRIDHYVIVDFNGFKQMVDALGGVQVCVPVAVNDTEGNIHLPAGTYNVTGQQALNYVRVRHNISPNGDIGRMKRQQVFIAAMIKKAVSAGTLANPIKLYNFLNAATQSLTTDPEFAHLKELANLGRSLQNIGLDNVTFITAPWQPYAPDPNRVELAPSAEGLWTNVRNDQPLGSEFTSQAIKASNGTHGTKAPTGKVAAAARALVLAGDPEAAAAEEKAKQDYAQTAAENGLCT